MSILKQGIITSNDFVEGNIATYGMVSYKGNCASYIPKKDTDNSCNTPIPVKFDYDNYNVTDTTVFRIIVIVSWSGFDSSSTAGTFSIFWQGSKHIKTTNEWTWSGGSQIITNALTSNMRLTRLVLSANQGSYIYNTTFTLPSSFRDTYDGQNVGIRTNYSNGVGQISVDSLQVLLDRYSVTSDIKTRIGSNYIACSSFNEI